MFFSDLEEKDMLMHIEQGDEIRYNVTKVGTVTFKRELGSPLKLKDVMFIMDLNINLIFISVLVSNF